MQYFHRTSLSPDAVVEEADRFFGAQLSIELAEVRLRKYQGSIGEIAVKIEAEGGHYTLVTIKTDQVGESEADKLSKRFLGVVHQRAEPEHEIRGAY
jgi:hypothetical protein